MDAGRPSGFNAGAGVCREAIRPAGTPRRVAFWAWEAINEQSVRM
jgi:hypothetical protein